MSRARPFARPVALVLAILALADRAFADAAAARIDALAELAISAADEPAIRAFVAENWSAAALAARPAEARATGLARVFRDLSGGTVESVLVASPTEAKIVARNAARDLWFVFDVELEPAPPRKIAGVGIQVDQQPPGGGEPEPSGEGGPLTEAEARQLLAAEIDRRATEDRFSGVLVVERDGRRLFEHAAGWADREAKIPVAPDTKFAIASIGKAFTEVVVRQLALEGKLDLAAPLARVLPGYPNREVAARVTIAQLLDHTSGLGDFTGALYSPRGAALDSPRALAD
jgi:CubicO group peptidase (beta-lactamase class C family)